ncbi:CD44 antigen isoform X13 [Podarcis muralis]
MAKVWLGAAVGFYLLQLSLARIDLNISCRYAGVFHVEKNRRYSLSREEAIELCKALNSTLPTWDQMQKAYDQGFETCRYGYIEEKIVVPRHTPYALCAANHTGIYVLSSNISDKYDTYCFNSSESRDIVCDPVIKLYSIWPDEDSKIEIYNPDGSHYIDGERFTKRPPINEDENTGGSGSANDRPTTDPNVISPGISSRFPHHTDDGTFTSKEPFVEKDEDATDVPNTHDGHHEGGHSKDQQPQSPTVVSTKDVKHDDSAHDSFLHGVHSEKDSEVRYSTNGTREDVLPRIVPLGDDEHYSTATAGSSSDDFFKQEDSTQNPLDGALSGLETEDTLPTTTASDVLHPVLVPSSERERTLEEESSHHTAVVSDGGSDHEDSTQDAHPGQNNEHRHPSNTSTDYFVPGIISSVEYVHGNETSHIAVGSSDDIKHEVATRDPTVHDIHHESGREDDYSTNSTKDEVPIEVIPPAGNNNIDNFYHTAVIHNDHEDSTQQPLPPIHQPGWDAEEIYPTNTSRDGIPMGVDSDSESKQTDVAKEDSTPEPVRQWGHEDKYTTKSTADVLVPGIVPRRGISQKNNTDHTAVVSKDGTKAEESTQDPQLHGLRPEWSTEDEPLVNGTQDYVLPGVFPEIDSGSDKHPSSPTASDNPNDPKGSGRGTHIDQTGESPKSEPRMAIIPDWLIVVASLLALALILGVCIAVNSRRRCGQKQKLIINNGKGGINEKNKGGLNGEASRSREMVHLVHDEKPENQTDEFQAIDETQNQQEVALKSGV